MFMGSMAQLHNRLRPFFAVIALQFGSAGMAIICKFTLDHGMSQDVLIVYRYAVATAVIAPFAIVLDSSLSLSLSLSLPYSLPGCLYVEGDEKASHEH
jgi:hypothetical protein